MQQRGVDVKIKNLWKTFPSWNIEDRVTRRNPWHAREEEVNDAWLGLGKRGKSSIL